VVYDSTGSNFGLIARSKSHIFPFLIALFATPAAYNGGRNRHRRLLPLRAYDYAWSRSVRQNA